MRSHINIIQLFLFLCSGNCLFAQGEYPGIINFTTKDGLPSSEVYDIIEDQSGYIWISTDNGVSRFDGYEFQNLGPKDGLPDPTILHLFEDHRGWIWMYSFKGNVFIYKDGVFTRPFKSELFNDQESTKPLGANWIYVDQAGTFYASFQELGVLGVTVEGCLTSVFPIGSFGINVWSENSKVYMNSNSYFGDDDAPQVSIDEMMNQKKIYFNYVNTPGHLHAKGLIDYTYNVPKSYLLNHFIQPFDSLIVFQTPGYVNLFDLKKENLSMSVPFTDGTILSYLKSRFSDFVYLGLWGNKGGVQVYKKKVEIFENQPVASFLEGETISHLLEDKHGGIWIGTISSGIFYLNNPQGCFNATTNYSINSAKSLASINGDSCWVLAGNNKIYSIGSYSGISELNNITPNIETQKLYYDQLQHVVFTVPEWYSFSDQPAFPINSRWINTVINVIDSYKDPSVSYLIGRSYFIRWQKENSSIPSGERIYLNPSQRILDVLECRDGRTFIAGTQGLYEFKDDEVFQKVIRHPALNNRIQDIEELPDGTLLVGTKGGGLLMMKSDTIIQISESEGLSSNFINSITLDTVGNLWVVAANGLNKIVIEDSIQVQALSVANGLPSNGINDISIIQNKLWLVTADGVTKVNLPLSKAAGPIQPVIESLIIDEQLPIRPKDLNELHWKQNIFSINFKSLDYGQMGEVLYRYRFTPTDNWQETVTPRIQVIKLEPGRYNFEVQALGLNGEWSTSSIWMFNLTAPFWKTFWFLTVLFLLAIALFVLIWGYFYKQRYRRLKKEQALVDLELEIENLQQMAYQNQMNPHFIANAMMAIQSFILKGNEGKLLASDYLAKFSKLIRRALVASRNSTISLEEDVKLLESYIQLEQLRYDHKFSYQISVDPLLDQQGIKIAPMLTQPYVENSILHGFDKLSFPGELNIHYQLKGENLHITIKDNGKGIFNNRLVKKDISRVPLGMEITEKRIKLLNPDNETTPIQIQELQVNGKVKGTLIEVSIPIRKNNN